MRKEIELLNNEKFILFYSKVLRPKFGGYITSSINLINCLSQIYRVVILVGEDIKNNALSINRAIFPNNPIHSISENNLDDVIDRYNIKTIVLNATSENDYIHNLFPKYNIPIITYEHGIPQKEFQNELIDRIKSSTFVLVPSEIVGNKIIKFSRDLRNKINVIPLPIDTSFYMFQSLTQNNTPTFVTACMIKPIRNLEALIEFFIKFKKSSSFKWLIVGAPPHYLDDSYLKKIKYSLKKNGLSSDTNFLGGCASISVLRNIFYSANIYIDFSREESYGQAKLEAIACGRAIIMPNVGNNKNLVHPDNQYMLCDNLKDMISKSEMLLHNSRLYNEVVKLNRKHIEVKYSYETIGTKLKEYI